MVWWLTWAESCSKLPREVNVYISCGLSDSVNVPSLVFMCHTYTHWPFLKNISWNNLKFGALINKYERLSDMVYMRLASVYRRHTDKVGASVCHCAFVHAWRLLQWRSIFTRELALTSPSTCEWKRCLRHELKSHLTHTQSSDSDALCQSNLCCGTFMRDQNRWQLQHGCSASLGRVGVSDSGRRLSTRHNPHCLEH